MALADEKVAEFLLQLSQHYVGWANHHQEQRATVANLLLVLAGAMVALVALDQSITHVDACPSLVLVVIGAFGGVWSAKQHQLHHFYRRRAEKYLESLDTEFMGGRVRAIQAAADDEMKARYRHTYDMRVWRLWVGLYLLIAVPGAGLAIASWVAPGRPDRVHAPSAEPRARPEQPSRGG